MIQVRAKVRFTNEAKGRKRLKTDEAPKVEAGRLPRVTKMMALAIRFDGLIRSGAVKDQADLARLGGVSRARVTQIMMLLNLAPAIQEEILFLPRCEREPMGEKELRPIALVDDWQSQSKLFRLLAVEDAVG